MPSAPRSVRVPDYPCSIDDAIAYLEALRVERPSALISRITVSDQRPDYQALADAVRERQPYRGSLTVIATELFPDMPERAAGNLVSGARRAGYIHNRAGRAQPAWYASDRGEGHDS
jgi:hypothetical protein